MKQQNSTTIVNDTTNVTTYYNMWQSPFNVPIQPGDKPYTQPIFITQHNTIDYNSYVVNTNPECYLTINKSRTKVFNDNVYLKHNTEFEFELYNPLNITIGVRFKINNIYIDNYLVLYPGKRIFLDCYLNTKNKFKFVTYDVENNIDVLNAIQNNGKIEIEFYQHIQQPNYQYYSTDMNCTSYNIETGIITNGDKSNIEFNNVNTEFSLIPFHVQKFNILPIAQKPIEPKDLIYKCKCNTKIKKHFKFCPTCGTKI